MNVSQPSRGSVEGADVSICMINHKGREHTLSCLRSIFASTHSVSLEVYVVENASNDGCAEAIRQQFPEVHILQNSSARSFTYNNNLAIRHCAGRFVLVLNNDTLLQPGALDILTRFMEQHPDCGAATARLLAPDGSPQPLLSKAPTLCSYAYRLLFLQNLASFSAGWRRRIAGASDYRTPTEVESISGACMFLRREVIDQVGMFDEQFSFYFEDLDWSYRIRQAGWRMYLIPEVRIVHVGGASLRRVRANAKIEEYRSACRYFEKHHVGGIIATPVLKGLWLMTSLLRLCGYSALAMSGQDGRKQDAVAYLQVLKWHVLPRR